MLADYRGARKLNWMVFWACLVSLFFSYPPTSMVVQGIDRELVMYFGTRQLPGQPAYTSLGVGPLFLGVSQQSNPFGLRTMPFID